MLLSTHCPLGLERELAPEGEYCYVLHIEYGF
jgi:hypothetical protein